MVTALPSISAKGCPNSSSRGMASEIAGFSSFWANSMSVPDTVNFRLKSLSGNGRVSSSDPRALWRRLSLLMVSKLMECADIAFRRVEAFSCSPPSLNTSFPSQFSLA